MNHTDKKIEITFSNKGRASIGADGSDSLFDVWDTKCGGDDCYMGNAVRLCAIWNFCHGHPTEVFEGKNFGTVRDALLSAVAEMKRMLEVIEYVEDDPLWEDATKGTGIATANGYRDAIEKAETVLKEICHGTDTDI